MKKLTIMVLINIAVSLIFTIGTNSVFAQRSHKDHPNWWIKEYGALAEDYPNVSRIHNTVFPKIRDAADKRGERPPRLLILKETGKHPPSLCIKDGYVILSKKAIDICYQGTNGATGDNHAAFVLGHELAHLAGEDWYSEEAVSDPKQKNRRLVIPSTAGSDDRKAKELRADTYAILYMTLAGFNPKVILDAKEDNFFQRWTSLTAKEDSHPNPKQRLEGISSKRREILENYHLFHIGTRLYQLGRYDEALSFLEAFNQRFPSREVYNNIGLIHYQKAMEELAARDPQAAYRFHLPVIYESYTLAENYRASGCEREILFERAEWYLDNACRKDKFYIPSRINYSSVLIMTGKYNQARGLIDEVLEIKKNDPKLVNQKDYLMAMNNDAIAMYLLGSDHHIKVDMFNEALDSLKSVIEEDPDFSAPHYNLARIQAERKRNAAAKENWRKYLELGETGPCADIAKRELGIDKSGPRPSYPPFQEPPPVRLGQVGNDTEKRLEDYIRYVPNVGTVRYAQYYSKNDINVLVLADVVEIVEAPVKHRMGLSQVKLSYGRPLKAFHNFLAGTETLVYDNFATDVRNDMLEKVIYFENRRPR